MVLVLASSPAAMAAGVLVLPNGFNLYNTGVQTSGSTDLHYVINGGSAFRVTGFHLSGNNTSSAWLGPNASGSAGAAKNVTFDLTTTLDLTGIEVAGFSLDGFWVSDNRGVDILVNGNSTGQTNNGAHTSGAALSALENAFNLSAADGLIAGLNSIVFRWGNGPDFGGAVLATDPTSVRVQFESYTLVPVPAMGLLFGTAALGLLRAGGRRRREPVPR
jgi:hypothetical protein